jgi:hypothetical protein
MRQAGSRLFKIQDWFSMLQNAAPHMTKPKVPAALYFFLPLLSFLA